MNNTLKIFFICLMLISPIIAGGGGDSSKELDPVYEAISHVADSMDIKKVGNNYEAGAMHALYPFFDFHDSSRRVFTVSVSPPMTTKVSVSITVPS